MDAIWKQKWIDALQSGQYNKGTGKLKYVDETGKLCHCALGVLCEIYSKENEIEVSEDRIYDSTTVYKFDGWDTVLPTRIQREIGIDSGGNFKDEHGLSFEIYELNDTTELTLPQIAEYVEKYF